MLIVVSLPFFIAYFVFPNTMMNIFVKSSETGIIDVGRIFLKIVTPFYFVISAKLTFDGILSRCGTYEGVYGKHVYRLAFKSYPCVCFLIRT